MFNKKFVPDYCISSYWGYSVILQTKKFKKKTGINVKKILNDHFFWRWFWCGIKNNI